jgi:hypothetical protein
MLSDFFILDVSRLLLAIIFVFLELLKICFSARRENTFTESEFKKR